ncbi:MAG: C1 family peptidase [Chloroflexota bacterium]
MPDRHSLGRVPSPPDVRDRPYSMAAFMAPAPRRLPAYKYWAKGPTLNQGSTPHCTGFAWAGWLAATPVLTRCDDARGHDIYARCKAIDGYAGDGTYIRAGAKVMQTAGHLLTYVWAADLDDLARWVLTMGPVVMGTAWHEAMFDPDEDGVMHPEGRVVGGHAYLVRGYSATRRQFRVVNSWGNGWGQNGQAWIGDEDLRRLMEADGEACTAAEVKR